MTDKAFKILKYAGSILILVVVIYFINKSNVLEGYSPSDVKEYLNTFGILAPIIYIILFTFVPLTLFPDSILAIAGGLAFGLIQGFIYTLIGSLLGATLSFYISRLLGRNFVEKIIGDKLANFEDKLQNNGFFIIFLLRIVPLFPFDIISYSAGLTKVKYKDFMFATVFGAIPGILVYTNLGDKSTQIGSKGFYISIVLLILLFAISIILKKVVPSKEIVKTTENR